MRLPFSESAFLDVFAAYNRALWPAGPALGVATLGVAIGLARGRGGARVMAALLVAHWAWSGIAYHAAFFARINPAARLFSAMFVFLVAGASMLAYAVAPGMLDREGTV